MAALIAAAARSALCSLLHSLCRDSRIPRLPRLPRLPSAAGSRVWGESARTPTRAPARQVKRQLEAAAGAGAAELARLGRECDSLERQVEQLTAALTDASALKGAAEARARQYQQVLALAAPRSSFELRGGRR